MSGLGFDAVPRRFSTHAQGILRLVDNGAEVEGESCLLCLFATSARWPLQSSLEFGAGDGLLLASRRDQSPEAVVASEIKLLAVEALHPDNQ